MEENARKCCACKGIRKCLLCEKDEDQFLSNPVLGELYFCGYCEQYAYPCEDHSEHCITSAQQIRGVCVLPDFITPKEEALLCASIDRIPWVDSQSGRRKHDFGPKVNFKKMRVRTETFQGFPAYSQFLIERMKTVASLSDFQPVEMCNLEYQPNRGSAIDPHFDDFWLWGERLVTVNLLSDTVYTLTQPTLRNEHILIRLPRRSIVVLSDEARHMWMHSVQRKHITQRRIGITIRELTPLFMPGGKNEDIGQILLKKAIFHSDDKWVTNT